MVASANGVGTPAGRSSGPEKSCRRNRHIVLLSPRFLMMGAVADAKVYLVAQIGRSVGEPGAVALRLAVAEVGLAEADRRAAEEIARATLAHLDRISEMIIDGRLELW